MSAKRIEEFISLHRYVSYSVLFAIMFLFVRLRTMRWGLGLLWCYDGLEQQYPTFIAEGSWLRDLLANVFSGQFVVPQWTMNTGYGMDYINLLLPSLGNPFNLFSVFATLENAELVLTAVAILQLYVAGIVFLRYCSYRRYEAFASLVGALVFVFSGYVMLLFVQLFMLYPLVLAPMLLLGVDKVFDGRSPVLFIVSIALSALYGVTMVYAACLLLLVYCLARYFLLDERKTMFGFARWFAKIAGCIALGLLIAGVLVVPTVTSILGQGRLGLERPQNLLYGFDYYLNAFSGLLYPVLLGADCFYGFSPLAIVCAVTLVATRRKGDNGTLVLGIMLAFMGLVVCSPVLGRVFNGFAYPNNRWVWALCLGIGIAVAQALPKIDSATSAQRRLIVAACAVFGLLEAVVFALRPSTPFAAGLIVFGLVFGLFVILAKKPHVSTWRLGALLSVPLWCLLVFWFASTSWPSSDMAWGASYRLVQEESPTLMLEASDVGGDSSNHYDGKEFGDTRNASLALGMPGSSYYCSFYNSYIDAYHSSLGLRTSEMNFSYMSYDARTSLEALAGVKYYIAPEGESEFVPSLYSTTIDRISVETGDYVLYEASASLPIAFQYARTLSAESFDGLSLVQRQNALLQGVVIDSSDTSSDDLDFSSLRNLEWHGAFSSTGGEVVIPEAGEPLVINVEIPAGSFAYVEIEGLERTDWQESLQSGAYVTFKSGSIESSLYEYFPSSHLYSGKCDWVVNLGKTDYDRHSIEVTASVRGVYRYSSFSVVLEDDVISAQLVSTLSRLGCEDVRYEGNTIAGSVTSSGGEGGNHLYFRVPYSEGWSARVDGEPAEIVRANIGFMAVWVDEGSHEFLLEYETPGLRLGTLLSAIGLIGTVVIAVICHRRESRAARTAAASMI